MVLTKQELIDGLQHEIRVLVHLAGKVDPAKLDYRPTPKQRSTLELVQYMAIMGPTQLSCIQGGVFNRETMMAAWSPAEKTAQAMTFADALAAIEKQGPDYAASLSTWTDDDLRSSIDMFGTRMTRGFALVTLILNAHAAYRMQLFLYLKSCGRDELNTMNLWMGIDGKM
jgi:hypothetical protein